ncbi:MAG: type II secretion system protein [Phycisphaerales bacterium JB060]
MSRPRQHTQLRAFSLVEILVTISVIAILIAITIPALRGARDSAESTVCDTTMRSLGQGMMLLANDNGGFWMNLFEDDLHAPTVTWTDGSEKQSTIGYDLQAQFWPGGLIPSYYAPGDPAEVWTCPQVMRHGYRLSYEAEQLRIHPADGAIVSYAYSQSLVTSADLWAGDDTAIAARWPDRDRYRRRVAIDAVAFPSQKGALIERAAFHDARRGDNTIYGADHDKCRRLGIVFCDGSVRRLERRDMNLGVPMSQIFDSDPKVDPVPVVTTRDGYLGVDVN